MSPATAPRSVLPADPRPVVVPVADHHQLAGGRCTACGHALALTPPRCARCGGAVAPEGYGPGGVLWAVSVVHVAALPGDEVPYTLGYLDLHAGPRVLVRLLEDGEAARVGDAAALTASTAAGQPAARVLR